MFRKILPVSESPESIAEYRTYTIHGVKQYVLCRGLSRSNPIILFIPGGPGFSEIPGAHRKFNQLENEYTLVFWDPRGCGRSFSTSTPVSSMTINQFEMDVLDLAQRLKEEFNQEKLVLMGHSWGAAIGLLTATRNPDVFSCYLGVGQPINMRMTEHNAYQYNLTEARKTGNKRALRDLERIGPPPFKNNVLKKALINRRWLARLGGQFYNQNIDLKPFRMARAEPEYNLLDAFNMLRGLVFSMRHLWLEFAGLNLEEKVDKIQIETHFLMGRHDQSTPPVVTAKFAEKRSIRVHWFENSAHHPYLEEPEKFQSTVLNILNGNHAQAT